MVKFSSPVWAKWAHPASIRSIRRGASREAFRGNPEVSPQGVCKSTVQETTCTIFLCCHMFACTFDADIVFFFKARTV